MCLEPANRRVRNGRGKWLVMVGIVLAFVVAGAPVSAQLTPNCETIAQDRLRHIVVADAATARQVEAQLQSGIRFETLAAKYSTDKKTRAQGGDLGFISTESLKPAVAQAISTLQIGESSKPIHTASGYEIFQVEERRMGTSCSKVLKPASPSPNPCG